MARPGRNGGDYGTVTVTTALCTNWPVLASIAVTVKVYVPAGVGVVVVPPPPPPPPVVEVLEQPTAVRAATESITASSAPQRRRRGIVSRSMQASVAPEPAAYQGVRPDRGWLGAPSSWGRSAAATWDAVTTNEVVPAVAEVIVTGETEKV